MKYKYFFFSECFSVNQMISMTTQYIHVNSLSLAPGTTLSEQCTHSIVLLHCEKIAQAFPIALSLLRGSVSHCSFLSAASVCRIYTCLFEHQKSLCIRRAVMAGKCCVIIGIRLILALYRVLGTGRMLSHCCRSLLFVQHCALLQGNGWGRVQVSEATGAFTQLAALAVLVFSSLSPIAQDQHFCSWFFMLYAEWFRFLHGALRKMCLHVGGVDFPVCHIIYTRIMEVPLEIPYSNIVQMHFDHVCEHADLLRCTNEWLQES